MIVRAGVCSGERLLLGWLYACWQGDLPTVAGPIRCPLQGDLVPIIGEYGAHYRAVWCPV
jgi:hypothetical protein